MTRPPLRVRTWIAVVIIVALGVPALYNAPNEWRAAQTSGQHASTVVEVGYGLCGLLAAIAVVSRASWARPPVVAWVTLITLTGGIAPYAWGGSSLLVAGVSAAVCALIATAIAMLALPSRWNPA